MTTQPTQTTPTGDRPAPRPAPEATPRTQLIPLPEGTARALATGGGVLTVLSTFLSWTWTAAFPGDLTVYAYPGGLQWLVLIAGALTALLGLASYGVKPLRFLVPAAADPAIRNAALAAFTTAWYTVIAIAVELGGLANLEPGGWVVAVASLATLVGAMALPFDPPEQHEIDAEATAGERFRHRSRAAWETLRAAFAAPTARPVPKLSFLADLLIIVVVLVAGLTIFTYGVGTEYDELFVGFLLTAGFGFAALNKSGLIAHLATIMGRHRNITLVGSFAAAAAYPFTQSNDQYTTIGVYILIFATVALGLNTVVGLAGLLDLGYVAFLGVGAYAAAMVSGSTYSPFDVHVPFWGALLVGGVASLIFGVVIGAPTLRLRGDYLAIVTLGFGEIFRITVNNTDGTSGPDITNGSNGISSIPDLKILGFDFGVPHDIGGFVIGRFANYMLLMLVITLIVVLVFRRSGDSRIGRAWVAIREDETAALAMGINGFRVKLVAFALGATLAGLAGTVQAHVTYVVTPEQYQFANTVPPNSAFLLAAVVLGGMGTISGPLVGASLLYLIPNKLQFLGDYQLFAFGVALVILMRTRPEGLIPNRRRQLEFHEAETPLADKPAVLGKTGA